MPANMVAQVADSLVKTGKVIRGYLGVSIQNITPALTESFALKITKVLWSRKSCPVRPPPQLASGRRRHRSGQRTTGE